ncbi:MAG: Gfo/Idh/MocA family oxidoreductase [Gracilimonas sp.]|nr:Gfo/Idh/MocA family oxidoreductase [Gracilimonas sp.]
MLKKVRWGVLSTAKIGTKLVIPAMQHGEYSAVVAISSRNKEKAKREASKLGIPSNYGSYEELLADDEIDAIYNPLPNHLHVPLTIKALQAGKHVLCEKPIALNTEEAIELLEKASKYPHLKVMEAFMYRFHPQWDIVRSWIKEGIIGEIRTIQSVFTYFNNDPDNIRNKPGMGGGGLMDIGCYCISASRYIFGEEPIDVIGDVEIDPDFGTDRLASGILKFPSGSASFVCSTQASPEQHLKVFGTEGIIEMDIPFNPEENVATVRLKKEGRIEKETDIQANHYTLQGEAFSKAILNDTPVPTPLKDAVANMKVIDALLIAEN